MKALPTGIAFKFGDNINTDYIISGKYKFKTTDPYELAKHLFEDLDKDFIKKLHFGDFIVAGKNFGCGSSRQQAPLAMKYAGIKFILAESFAPIFFRNAVNLGLYPIQMDTSKIDNEDILSIDLENAVVYNKTKNITLKFNPLPKFLEKIIQEGGLLNYFKKYKDFILDE